MSREVKHHTLALPNSCIKGTDEIYEFFAKYIGLGVQSNPRAEPEQRTVTPAPAENADLQSYYKSAIAAGDEEREKSPF